MLYTTLFLVILVFLRNGVTIDEDNLRNALNSIENRQKQLASNYYVLPNKDPERVVHVDDDNLMYLDPTPPDYDTPHRSQITYPSKASMKNFRGYEDDGLSDGEIEDYQKRLNERLLERLMLDILKNGDEVQSHQRPQKKSFFREREINEVAENLQNLHPNGNADENEIILPSSFRERVKSKLHSSPHSRVVNPYDTESFDNDDHLNVLNPLWRKYEGVDPETLTDEDMRQFMKYLNEKKLQESDGYNPEFYLVEGKERDRSKRYWLGGGDSRDAKYSIQKRSAGFVQKSTTEKVVVAKTNMTQPKMASADEYTNKTVPSTVQKSKVLVKTMKSKKGQQEILVSSKSLKPLNIKKKSIDWSNYFGVDKRQKKSNPLSKEHKNDVLLDQYIQSHILQSVRNSAFNNQGNNYRYFPKRNSLQGTSAEELKQKLETAENLKNAEDLIIDHVLKFTGAHDGIMDPANMQRFREKVIDELGAAYNLEKLRSEIFDDSKLKMTVRKKKQHRHSDMKRVAVKKENVELLPTDLENMKMNHNTTEYGHNPENFFFYDFNKQMNNINEIVGDECPILYEIVEKCLQISFNVKDRESALTPFCALHHVCNICSTKEELLSCDLSFIADVNAICGDEPICRYTAQRVLHAMQTQGPKSYISTNTCDPCIGEILQYSFEK